MTISHVKIPSTDSLASANAPTKNDRKYLYRKTDPKTGARYVYFRFTDRLAPLPADEQSESFAREYDARLREREQSQPHDRRPRDLPDTRKIKYGPGMVGRFIIEYRSHPRSPYQGLSERTKYNYGKAFDLMRARVGTGLLADFDEEAVEVYTAEIARECGPTTADLHRSLLSNLWEYAKGFREFKRNGRPNPTVGATKHYQGGELTKPWPEDVQEWFIATAKRPLVDGYYLLRFTGQRGGDATKLKWTDLKEEIVTLPDGQTVRKMLMRIVQEKTDTVVWHELPAPLVERLDVIPRLSGYILTSNWKRPWVNATTLSHAIRRHFDKHGKKRHKMHGLRATVACEILSMDGGTIEAVKSITGHLSDRTAKAYAAEFDQRRVNRRTVNLWNEELSRKAAHKVGERRATIRVVS